MMMVLDTRYYQVVITGTFGRVSRAAEFDPTWFSIYTNTDNSNSYQSFCVAVAMVDMDNDGDNDLVSVHLNFNYDTVISHQPLKDKKSDGTNYLKNDFHHGAVLWWENLGMPGNQHVAQGWPSHVVHGWDNSGSVSQALAVH